jgi:3-deoxy-D-manno-octulosonic-acid transferase
MQMGIRIAALFNPKAKLWVAGRKNILQQIEQALSGKTEKRIWIHCSSLGEFEQGRPVIETIKQDYPDYKIVLTFFSPSGYEIRKDYTYADYVFYLPIDSANNAKHFINLINPSLAIFVKYEFWYHYLNQLKTNNIPTILISATFRSSQVFFKPHGGIFRKMLQCFDYLFVQDEVSVKLLSTVGVKDNVIVSGDTRYDRVAEIASIAKKYPLVEKFKEHDKLFIAGSTWPADEKLLEACLDVLPEDWKLIIAPHEIHGAHIKDLQDRFLSNGVLYSEMAKKPAGYRVLIVDNIGMLSSLYSYGEIAYVGGGFDKGGIHNILEPAVFGLPVFMGPIYDKFIEAKAMVSRQYAFPVSNAADFNSLLQHLVEDDAHRKTLQDNIRAYVSANTGATKMILDIVAAKWLK